MCDLEGFKTIPRRYMPHTKTQPAKKSIYKFSSPSFFIHVNLGTVIIKFFFSFKKARYWVKSFVTKDTKKALLLECLKYHFK